MEDHQEMNMRETISESFPISKVRDPSILPPHRRDPSIEVFTDPFPRLLNRTELGVKSQRYMENTRLLDRSMRIKERDILDFSQPIQTLPDTPPVNLIPTLRTLDSDILPLDSPTFDSLFLENKKFIEIPPRFIEISQLIESKSRLFTTQKIMSRIIQARFTLPVKQSSVREKILLRHRTLR